jgi:hypothetical protein
MDQRTEQRFAPTTLLTLVGVRRDRLVDHTSGPQPLPGSAGCRVYLVPVGQWSDGTAVDGHDHRRTR